VFPDSPYRRLVATRIEWGGGFSNALGVEWEINSYPEFFWPTPGDRVSVWGYWIHDCGHEGYTEIHPPVGAAVHRTSPVRIPADKEFRFDAADERRSPPNQRLQQRSPKSIEWPTPT
jgi:hypothetical protein